MDPAVLVALMAAAAVLLMVYGLFGGRRVSPTERIEQVAIAATEARRRDEPRRGKTFRERLFGGRTAAAADRAVSQRDWGSSMARDLARADGRSGDDTGHQPPRGRHHRAQSHR